MNQLPTEKLITTVSILEKDLAKQLQAESAQPFDLSQYPLLRVKIFHVSDRKGYVLSMVMHHIISDGWSVGLLQQELSKLYTALTTQCAAVSQREEVLPSLPIQYVDFAIW